MTRVNCLAHLKWKDELSKMSLMLMLEKKIRKKYVKNFQKV